MRLWALSDVHTNHGGNGHALAAIPPHPGDGLLVVGDVAERVDDVVHTLAVLADRFEKVWWVPGNHELWSTGSEVELRGVSRYLALVSAIQSIGVRTPECPYERWPGLPDTWVIPMFIGYDYSFCPPGLDPTGAKAWAREAGIVCTDEHFLHPDPYPTREAWCAARLAETERRLAALPDDARTILVNHWTLREDLVRLWRIPRFAPWCGTKATEDWHQRYRARVVVSGHLHMRATDWRDGVRFEEVSLGYPKHWDPERPVTSYLREILPGPPGEAPQGSSGPLWRR
jgi:3',5'-cyclic AMP phosphodiesterase CpdA